MRRADYGIDAPVMQRNLAIVGLAGVVLVFFLPEVGRFTVWPGALMLAAACLMLWGSRIGKLRLRDRLLDAIPWRGDESVLDVGCGRGLMAIAAAKRVPRGGVVGVDVWSGSDLSGNTADQALENAKLERVVEKVKFRDADARELPFPDAEFDVVLSSWALHNISVAAGRDKAIREIVRVLKPGGWIGILDIEDTHEYEACLKRNGMRDVSRVGPNFMFVVPTFQVLAVKPAKSATASADAEVRASDAAAIQATAAPLALEQ